MVGSAENASEQDVRPPGRRLPGSSPRSPSAPAWLPSYPAMQNKLEQEGFVDRAVSVLKRAGYNAWINPVVHVAVDPRSIAAF